MSASKKLEYYPSLRLKSGELIGLGNLADDVAECVVPRMIVPPLKERNTEAEPSFLAADKCPDISQGLATVWSDRDILVDASYLVKELGSESIGGWYRGMFLRLRDRGVRAIPLVRAKDFLAHDAAVYTSAIESGTRYALGVIFSSGELADVETPNRLLRALSNIEVSSQECLVIADFHDADFSQPDLVAPIIGGVLDLLRTAAPWRKVVFQGTNYPVKNPAQPGSVCLVPRNEWIAWRQSVQADSLVGDHVSFGDYAADCAQMNFGGAGTAAIPHHRYATAESWLVCRGREKMRFEAAMVDVCRAIVDSGKFSGRTFSSADEWIFRVAVGQRNPGAPKEWRAVNTTHHITQVVRDLGSVLGISFGDANVTKLPEQVPLFLRN